MFSSTLQGRKLALFESEVEPFLNRFLADQIDPRVHLRFKNAKERGEKTFLLSSAPEFLVRQIGLKFGFDLWQGTEYCVDKEGRLCQISTLIDGTAKLQCAQSFLQADTVVYSDSEDDLPLLEWAGKAVVVRPSRRLRIIAAARNWEIL